MDIKALQVGYIGTNCYILADEETRICALVDPGGDADQIETAVQMCGYTPCAVFLTHGHDDHVGAVSVMQQLWPEIPVYLNERDVYPQDDREIQKLFPHVDGKIVSYDEGDQIAVGNLTVSVLATPGHSEGSVTLLCGEAMFCGDTLFPGSCGRTDFVGGSTEKILASLKRLGQLEGNYRVLPGHGSPTDLDRERKKNPYMYHALNQMG